MYRWTDKCRSKSRLCITISDHTRLQFRKYRGIQR